MRWCNHKFLTFSAVFSVTGGFIAAFSAMVGSVLPDVLEFRGMVQHRTVTHYPWFWFLACAGLWLIMPRAGAYALEAYCAFFVASGGLLHVCQDALGDSGVPYITPYGPRKGLGVYHTQMPSETMAVVGMVVLFLGFAWYQGFIDPEYLTGEAVKTGAILQQYLSR